MADVSEDYIHEWRKKLLCLCTVGEDCLRLLLRFYLNPDPSADTDTELADVFKNAVVNKFDVICTSKIKSLNFPSNDKKIYKTDATGTEVVKDTINIDEFDITFMGDILKNINSLMYSIIQTGVPSPCKNGHTLCCQNHSHRCVKCNKITCNNTPNQCCTRKKCDHKCSQCGNLHSFCRRQSMICCDTCKLCLNCSAPIHCDNVTLQQHIDIIKKELRNCSMHLTNKECENPNFDFPEVSGCNTWNKVLKRFVDTLEYIIIYLRSNLYITKEIKDELFIKIEQVESGKAFYKHFERAVNDMVKSAKGIKDMKEDIKDVKIKQHDGEQKYGTLKENIAELTKDVEYVKIKQNEITENERRDENGVATRNVLKIIAKEINTDWKTLSCKLGVNLSPWESLRTINKSCEECLNLSFEKLQYKILWKDLRDYLIQMNRNDVMELVERENSITLGDEKRNTATIQLKQYYQETLMKWNQPNAFKGERGKEYVSRNRRDVFVQLMMGEWIDGHENDREHFLRGMYQQRENIEMHELLDGEGKFIIIRGIAGIGKTSFVDSLVLDWANGEIYKDYDFVIKFTCRELNVLNKVESFCELLDHIYPGELNNLIYDSINDSNTKVLIILDGLDEFRYLKDIIKISKGNPTNHILTSVVYDLINPDCHPNKKVIVCGRPQASEEIYNCFHRGVTYKLVEIAGFDQKNVNLFIDKYFVDSKVKAKMMKQKLLEQVHLQAMVRIPIYAYILCNVFNNGALLEELDTATKLNIAACLVFLRSHMRNYDKDNEALIHLCHDKTIVQTIRELSKFAYKSLIEQRIVFNEDDFCVSEYLSSIEDSGIFEKHEGGENGDIYQFKHLVLQEFFSAIHILDKSKNIRILRQMPQFNNSILILIGLVGLLHNKSSSNYLKAFAKGVIDFKEENLSKYDMTVTSILKSFDTDKTTVIVDAVHEYNCDLPEDIQTYFLEQTLRFKINYHHELQKLAYFLKNIRLKCVKGIDIEMQDGNLSAKEMLEISPYLVKAEENIFRDTDIQVEGYKHLTASISKSHTLMQLKMLRIIRCYLNDERIIALSKSIPYLESLDLRENQKITLVGITELSQSLYDSQTHNKNSLKELKLSTCDLNDECIMALSKTIPYLELLNLKWNKNITSIGFEEISRCICDSRKQHKNLLKELKLSTCDLNDESIIALSKSIPYLESLDLGCNKNITTAGFAEISRSISNSQQRNENSLKQLKLYKCNLNDESIITLSNSIPYLKSLDITSNKHITSIGINEISRSIRDSETRNENSLRELELSDRNLNDESIIMLSKLVPHLRIIN